MLQWIVRKLKISLTAMQPAGGRNRQNHSQIASECTKHRKLTRSLYRPIILYALATVASLSKDKRASTSVLTYLRPSPASADKAGIHHVSLSRAEELISILKLQRQLGGTGSHPGTSLVISAPKATARRSAASVTLHRKEIVKTGACTKIIATMKKGFRTSRRGLHPLRSVLQSRRGLRTSDWTQPGGSRKDLLSHRWA